jgi:hypothetical protein
MGVCVVPAALSISIVVVTSRGEWIESSVMAVSWSEVMGVESDGLGVEKTGSFVEACFPLPSDEYGNGDG